MAGVRCGLFSTLGNLFSRTENALSCGIQQAREVHIPARMRRDMKRRNWVKEWAPTRLRYLALKRNDILPPAIALDASKVFEEKIPRQSAIRQTNARCVVTNRGRGVVVKWRLSRFIFRELADYNKFSGVIRAIW